MCMCLVLALVHIKRNSTLQTDRKVIVWHCCIFMHAFCKKKNVSNIYSMRLIIIFLELDIEHLKSWEFSVYIALIAKRHPLYMNILIKFKRPLSGTSCLDTCRRCLVLCFSHHYSLCAMPDFFSSYYWLFQF